MAACRGSSSKWFFTREQLETTPSRRCGVEPDRELSYRQQAANLIQDMGQRLNVSQLTINTAIVYMHRFYMNHSFTKFHRNIISPTTLFLAAKVEEQPRKLEHVIKVAHACLNPQEAPLDTKSNYKPTVIACVCIHLACKWSNWEIPVSTDGKHWWEYVDNSVTLELLDELTHEFLQILEKTPSRLKRIRNWRATQVAKKPKGDGQSLDNSFAGPSLVDEHSLGDSLPGVSNPAFSKVAAAFPVPLPGGPLSLDTMGSLQGSSYTFTAPSDWPQEPGRGSEGVYPPLKQDALGLQQGAPLSLQGSLHHPPHRPDKGVEFNPVKHEHKGGGGGGKQQQQPAYPPPPPPPPPPPTVPAQKLSLDKYREKQQAAEMAAGQKRRQEQQGMDSEGRDLGYAPSAQSEHRKHSQPHPFSQPTLGGGGSSSSSTASPLKMKLGTPGHNKPPSDRREKGAGSLKLRLPVPSQGGSSKEELKMKIKVSSDRHSSSDEGGAKSKHSSPLVSKEKHRDREHIAHSHAHRHHKHGHAHSGNGRGGPEGPGGAALLRSPLGLTSEGVGLPLGPTSSSSSRKRLYPEASHNHHSSKSSRRSKGSAGGLRTSQHPSETGQEASGEPRT